VENATQQGDLRSVFLAKYSSGDHTQNTEIGRSCSTYGVDERCIRGFGGET
jgi:hypothetical protein